MKSVILTTVICSVISCFVGFYLGNLSKSQDQEYVYCLNYKVYTDGILNILNSSDIETAPETKSRLITELKLASGQLQYCLETNLQVKEIVEETSNKAFEYLQKL